MPHKTKPKKGLRFGLIGCGDIGQVRAAALRRAHPHSLVAVSDVDPQRAGAIAGSAGMVVDREWRTLVRRDEVDAVIVATPPSLHAEMCIEAMECGKHVLCEKPLARSPQECEAMLEAARHTGRFLATGFNYRFYPSFALARRLLDEGRIGALSHIRAYGGYSATGHNRPWVHDTATVGGGALHDIGIHLIDLTRWFLGEVTDTVGMATGSVWNFPDCEDNGFVLMRGEQGRVATLHASWTEWGRYQFLLELVGERGTIRASCFPMRTELIWAERTGERTRRRMKRFRGTEVGEHLRSYRWVVARSFVLETHAFARAIAGEASAVATGRDGLRAIEIAWAGSRADGAPAAGVPLSA